MHANALLPLSYSSQKVDMTELETIELVEVKNTPYLSTNGKHYASAEWYRETFLPYYIQNADFSVCPHMHSSPSQGIAWA